jgi:hypothetical protein
MFSTQKVAATPSQDEVRKGTTTNVQDINIAIKETVPLQQPVVEQQGQTTQSHPARDVKEPVITKVEEVQQQPGFVLDREQGRILEQAAKNQQTNSSMVQQALKVEQSNISSLDSVSRSLQDNSSKLNAAWTAEQEYERKLMEAQKLRDDISSRLENAKKSELDKNRLLQEALAAQQGNAGQLGASLSTEQARTQKIEELLAAQRDKTNNLQSAFIAEQANTRKLQEALRNQQDIISQLEKIRLSQPGNIAEVQRVKTEMPTSYVKEEVQKTVVTVDNRTTGPQHATMKMEQGSGMTSSSMKSSEHTGSSSSSQQQQGTSGLGYHPLTPEGIEKATYSSMPLPPSGEQTTGYSTTGTTVGETGYNTTTTTASTDTHHASLGERIKAKVHEKIDHLKGKYQE